MMYFAIGPSNNAFHRYIEEIVTTTEVNRLVRRDDSEYTIDKDTYIFLSSLDKIRGTGHYKMILLPGWDTARAYKDNIDECMFVISQATEVFYVK